MEKAILNFISEMGYTRYWDHSSSLCQYNVQLKPMDCIMEGGLRVRRGFKSHLLCSLMLESLIAKLNILLGISSKCRF